MSNLCCEPWIRQELDRVCKKVTKNIARFGENFPSACATQGMYRIKGNDDWTNGFWTAMLLISYLHTQDTTCLETAKANIKSFCERLEQHYVLDHHDIGFLYSLSAGAGWNVLRDTEMKDLLCRAADVLAARFQTKGGFIQAWGKMGDPKEYRLIIDSLLNLPLLYTAADLKQDPELRKKADSHYQAVIHNIVREDGSTYHTFYFDPETGASLKGATHQGFSDSSCWARGQAWAILGMPLHSRISGEAPSKEEKKLYEKIVRYFETHLPSDQMPYWDLVFTDGSDQPRDSSALAIAACGMLEAGRTERAMEMMRTLHELAAAGDEEGEGLLLHGVYAYAENKGVDEPNLWGDYFYMEALYRMLHPEWETFWISKEEA